jgi:hypothetical protein
MCRDRSTVKIHLAFFKFPIKWQNGDKHKILEDNNGRLQFGSLV